MDIRVRFICDAAYDASIKAASVNPIIKCPICRIENSCKFCCDGIGNHEDNINYIVQCSSCGAFLLARYRHFNHNNHLELVDIFPNSIYKNSFPSNITNISKRFIDIYEQAMTAKEQHLDALVGMGLRKSFEFLIYDYIKNVLALEPAKTLEKRIEQIDVKNVNVNATLVRWVGNDHTHTETKHPEFSIDEMLNSIDLVVYYLLSEYKSREIAEKIKGPQSPQ